MKQQILLPLAAILIATPVWARQQAHSSPGLRLSTTALSFNGSSGNVSSQPITITATKPVTITSVTFSNSAFFDSSVSLPVTLSSRQSITGQISARPQSTAQTGTLTIGSTAGTLTVSLNETATTPAPTSHSVNLSWNAPSASNPVDSYQVDRAIAGSTQYSTVGTTTAASTAFTDTSVTNGQSYVYEVRSVDDQGTASSPSNTVTLAIP